MKKDDILRGPAYEVTSDELFGKEFGEEVIKAWRKAKEEYDDSYGTVEFQMDPTTFEMIPVRKFQLKKEESEE